MHVTVKRGIVTEAVIGRPSGVLAAPFSKTVGGMKGGELGVDRSGNTARSSMQGPRLQRQG
jgi:hypothetical protein